MKSQSIRLSRKSSEGFLERKWSCLQRILSGKLEGLCYTITNDTFPSFLLLLTDSSREQQWECLLTPTTISHHGHSGVKCSIKANEGLLFCLDKSFMFVPKPATYIQIENISVITMSRVGGAISASRTFDITVSLKGGMGEHQFSNINRYGRLECCPRRAKIR